jgi:Zn-dependent protease with chaperone function
VIPSPDVLRALAHGILDVTAVSAILSVVAFAVARIPGVDAGARSRWWSAAAVVPVLAFAAAIAQPLVVPARPAAAAAYAGRAAILIDPMDTLLRTAETGATAVGAPANGAPSAAPGSRPAADAWLANALALWFAFALYRVARVLVSVARAHRLATGASLVVPHALTDDAAASRVALRSREDLDTPVAIGLSRRVVIVPTRLVETLPRAELRAVVLHEIAHLRRRDDWTFLLERLACAVLWVNPLIALAARSAATWREIACDAHAARELGGRVCASALWRSASVLATAGGDRTALALLSGATLVDRVEALLRPSAASARRTLAATLALVVFAGTAGVLVAVRAPAYGFPGARGLTLTGSMHTRRASFAFVKLRDGRVLVAGGMIANHDFTNAAELYDPARGVFEPTGSLLDGRTSPTGTLLPDGRVLVAGGWTMHGITASAEIYDPASGRFSAAAPMTEPRAGHTATALADGTVLMAGGFHEENAASASAEVYDPRRNTFIAVGPLREPRGAHTATLLGDGRVLIAGGLNGTSALRTSELYAPATRRFTAGPAMLEPRSKHGATLLADGSVLITGGSGDSSWSGRLNTAERYDPRSNRFVAAAPMSARRFKLPNATARLPNGDVLVAGGSERVELYDAARDRFRVVGPSMDNARNFGGALLLDDGSVLIAGGYASVDPLPTTETALRYR